MKGYISYFQGDLGKSLESFKKAYHLNNFDIETKVSYAFILLLHNKIRESNDLLRNLSRKLAVNDNFLLFYHRLNVADLLNQ